DHPEELEDGAHARAVADHHRIHRQRRRHHGELQTRRRLSNSGISSRSAVSMPRYSVMCALGHPAHIPVSFTLADLPSTAISSISPPSACMKGRARLSTASTRSLVIMLLRTATGMPAALAPKSR